MRILIPNPRLTLFSTKLAYKREYGFMAIHVNENGTIQELASQSKGDIKLQKVDYLFGPYTISCSATKVNGPSLREVAQSENLKLMGDYQNMLPTSYYPAIVREYDFEPSVALIMHNYRAGKFTAMMQQSSPSLNDIEDLYEDTRISYYTLSFLSKELPYHLAYFHTDYDYGPNFASFKIGYPLLVNNKIYISLYADRVFNAGHDFDIYFPAIIFLFA